MLTDIRLYYEIPGSGVAEGAGQGWTWMPDWIRSAWRSIAGKPMFSAITIASLTIGCCGALLAWANLKQHLSYERFLPHADRIAKVVFFFPEDAGGMASVSAMSFGTPDDRQGASRQVAPALHEAMEQASFPEIVAQ